MTSQFITWKFTFTFFFSLIIKLTDSTGLYCAKGDTPCGNFNSPVGYLTSGGGHCGSDAVSVLAPVGTGTNYSKYWCGSYFVGVLDASWGTLKPV
jgi:hypothetical protein